MDNYEVVVNYLKEHAFDMLCKPVGEIKHHYVDPGAQYSRQSWDWDSFYTVKGLIETCEYFKNDKNFNYEQTKKDLILSAKGYILNFLELQLEDGFIPIMFTERMLTDGAWKKKHFEDYYENQHKPFLCQGVKQTSEYANDYSWFDIEKLVKYMEYYKNNQYHKKSGLYIWNSDFMIGMDNNPTVFGFPFKSTADIYLNSYLHVEFNALADLLEKFNDKRASIYREDAKKLKEAVQRECYDIRDGMYYSVYLDLKKHSIGWIHTGIEMNYCTLPIKIRFAGCLLPIMTGISTPEQNEIIINRHYLDEHFLSPYGLRSTASDERMYSLQGTSNPSNNWGPIWLIHNYIAFESLITAGRKDLAKDLLDKLVRNYANDIVKNGKIDECYSPDTGEPIMNQSFLSWNVLILQMINQLK